MSSSKEDPSASSDERDGPQEDHAADDDPRPPGTSSDLSAWMRAVKARRAEYIRPRTVRIKVGSWNVAAIQGTERDVGQWFVEGKELPRQFSSLNARQNTERESKGPSRDRKVQSTRGNPEGVNPDEVGIYVLGLQEIVDLSSFSEAIRPYVDPGPANRWKEAVQTALPAGYQLVSESQLVGLLLLVYAAPNVAPTISSVSSATVGTGLMGYMGNKGAVVTRLVLGETTRLVFVNSHLAAGSDKSSLERRNWDASQIVARAKFEPLEADDELYPEPSDTIGKEDFAFWFGDLNYRLEDIPGEDVRRLLMLHSANEYDAKHRHRRKIEGGPPSPVLVAEYDSDASTLEDSKNPKSAETSKSQNTQQTTGPISLVETMDPRTDPSSLLTTLSSLLPHDQLRSQQEKKKAFHDGWREGEIRFLPTYKYDVGSIAMFDSSEKQRGPSWCDRILYRSKQDRLDYEKQVREAEEARKRDEEMKERGIDKAADDESVLFDYNPETDGTNEDDEYNEDDDSSRGSAPSEEHAEADEPIQLTHYTSHQGVMSSDHKPLDAAFTLTYDAVIPDLKTKVHQDVVRQLDKAENEALPVLTVVIDHHEDDSKDVKCDIAYDENAIYLGGVPYGVPISRNMTIANTGSVPATFCFSSRLLDGPHPEGKTNPPPWLDVRVDWPADERGRDDKKGKSPDKYTLAPGDSVTVEITSCVKNLDYVRALNAGKAKIEDILVLKVTGGRDHFIPLYGRWLPTCFGRSVEELTHMPEAGARSLGSVPPSEAQKAEESIRLSAPRELFRLTEAVAHLCERAVAEWGMMKAESDGEKPPWLSEPHGLGWPFSPESWTLRDPERRAPLLTAVREALDIGSSLRSIFPPEVPSLPRLEILAETLVSFLRSLADGVVQADTWKTMELQLAAREKSKTPWRSPDEIQAWVLDVLASSPAHSVSFTFLTFMLNQIINEIAPASNPSALPPPLHPPPPPSKEDPKKGSADSTAVVTGIMSPTRRERARSSTGSGDSDNVYSYPGNNNNPTDLRRQAVEMTLSSIFSDLMISAAVPAPTKEKERRAWEDRKRIIVQAFLQPTTTPNPNTVDGEDEQQQQQSGEK